MSGLLNFETAIGSLGNVGTAPVTLGGLLLQGVEVPSRLAIGGDQALTIHKLIGGDRVMQAMGPDPAPIELAGMFTGPGALARAQQLMALRDVGRPLRLAFAGISLMVVIRPASYTYQQQGAVIPYSLSVEVQPTVAAATSSAPSALSSLVGPDVASAVTAVSNTVAQASAYAGAVAGQLQAVVGQVAPVASLIGAGGLLAGVEDRLTVVGTLAGAGTNFAAAPAAAASAISGLQAAGAGLTATLTGAGANLVGISAAAGSGNLVADMPSLMAAIASAGAASAAATAGGFLNRSAINVQLASGVTATPALVHS